MNRRYRINYLIILILIIAGCSNNDSSVHNEKVETHQKQEPTAEEVQIDEDVEDLGETECVRVELIKNEMNQFPFSRADKVVVHSFKPDHEGGLQFSKIEKEKFHLKGIEQSKELTKLQIVELYNVLYGTRTKRKGNIALSMACYNPHHTIVFFEKNIPIEFIEICVECEDYRTNRSTYIDFCDEKWCNVYNYFQSIGITKSTDVLKHRCEKN